MKRLVLLATFVFATFATLLAQREFYGRTVRLGFKLDPVFSNTLSPKDNGVEKDGSGFGVNYGLMADIMFSDGRGAFATGLEVAHAGAKLLYTSDNIGLRSDLATTGQDQRYHLKLQYLQIPVSVKLRTNPMDNGMLFWGQFGTYFGALIGSRTNYTIGSNTENNVKTLKETNKLNMGLLVGGGAQYPIAEKTDLYLGLGLENGFTDITSNKQWNDGKVILNRWAIRLGVFF
ncbi:MAG: porin family protein [Niabella sp.]